MEVLRYLKVMKNLILINNVIIDNIDYSYDSKAKNLLRQITFKNNHCNLIEIPTNTSWSHKNKNHIYVSYIAPYIKQYDIENGKSISEYTYYVEKNLPFESQQTNKIFLSEKLNLIITGHEDAMVKFWNEQVKLI